VNGGATAIKNMVTLGLSSSQLQLIGVTDADRELGYDTSVAIATASGEVLIAVGTGGVASALSKGGTVARTASGALVAFDAAGNAVGVVQGVYDAKKNGLTVNNGLQIAGGSLGLSANVFATKSLATASAKGETSLYRVGKHGDMPSPRPGQNSHHGVMSAWMENIHPDYDAKKAPAILMPVRKHHDTYRVFNKWKAEFTRRLGGTFNWKKVSEPEIRALSEKMFDAGEVPFAIRQEYWLAFDKMKSALQR